YHRSSIALAMGSVHTFKGEYLIPTTPVTLGHEFSGVVVEVGPDVTSIKVGDRVTSETTFLE
ncbi:alcohol dehydrogenase catalytic domain-containing protein, partial [Serratia marcescens]|uniref:alcohol dehydrogenase catalytic domain-containing protein n=1 Tax=Serratia marcescens TaxID=615 RepID=UPI003C6F01D9